MLEPLGGKEKTLRMWLLSNAGYGPPPGVLPEHQGVPMFSEMAREKVLCGRRY